ncbi:MAG TPA: hypothetical protein VJ917_02270, partial [Saprospiraceae bacterium]|nr:hypothetical protein [Saprospiraceae bacterium]
YCTVVVVFFSFFGLTAQDLKPKEHVELGEQLMERGAYLEAAEHFNSAWEDKKKKEEWIFMAGEAYEKAMDYENAASAYEQLLDEKKYPDAELRLATMLKQTGDYTRANKLFLDYLYDYDEDDKREVEQQVQSEIRGCELGIQLLQTGNTSGLKLEALSDAVNSPGHETNPIPFDQSVLYYNSDITGNTKFYRSEKKEDGWSKGMVPPLFPNMENLSVNNGAFSPDFKRFYFNQCEDQGNGLTGEKNCALYYIVREEDSWTEPIRMKDYINVSGTSNAHPYVVYLDQKEIIYFSSNRSGGHGGKDLWYIVRDLTSDISEYTFPTNLGKNINSAGDEIAPFYSAREGNLYFSSNGRVSMGGYDIFRSKGSEAFWENAENAGLPFNSAAEDFQYRTNSSGNTGYLVSNRKHQGENNTTHLDIFSFEITSEVKDVVLTGQVLDESQENVVENVTVLLLQKEGSGFQMVNKLESKDGAYRFILKPQTSYKLLVEKQGYLSTEMTLNASSIANSVAMEQDIIIVSGVASSDRGPKSEPPVSVAETDQTAQAQEQAVQQKASIDQKQPIQADENAPMANPAQKQRVSETRKKQEIVPVDNKTVRIASPKAESNPSPEPGKGKIVDAQPVDAKKVAVIKSEQDEQPSGQTENKVTERKTEGGEMSGIYYKVQICSVGDFNPNNSAFDKVRYLGNLDTEFLASKGMTRVLLGTYRSRSDAEDIGRSAKKSGFPGAFIVEYKDGQRLNR